CLGKRAQVRQAVVVEYHLIGQGAPVGADSAVGQRGHRRAAGGDALVQAQGLASGNAVERRAFVGRGLDETIAQGQRTDAQRLEGRSDSRGRLHASSSREERAVQRRRRSTAAALRGVALEGVLG